MIKGCLVLEGGAFRGVYEEGIIDFLMENDMYFECVIGVSAGALNGVNYLSKQIGRSAKINIGHRHDKRYINEVKVLQKKIVNLNFLFEEADEEYPFDYDTFASSKQRFIAVATNCKTGKAEYFEKGKCDIFTAVKASASMPFISDMVDIDGDPYLDGGCADKIPYDKAIEEGYAKVVVLRTRDADYRKEIDYPKSIIETFYRDYPAFVDILAMTNKLYNEQCDRLEILNKLGIVYTIGPSEPLNVGRLEKDLEVLKDAYELGRKDAEASFEGLKAYLGI